MNNDAAMTGVPTAGFLDESVEPGRRRAVLMIDTRAAEGRNADAGSDNEIMSRVKDGHIGDLAILFERHSGRLLSFFMRMTGSRSTSEDLVQDVFTRMLRYRKTYRGDGGEFGGWMFTMARNAHTDHIRRTARHDLPPLPEQEPESGTPSAAEAVETKESVDLLRIALQRLSPEKREILVLRRFHFKKFEEVARILGCPVNTAKVRAHRALRELRKIYLSLQNEATT